MDSCIHAIEQAHNIHIIRMAESNHGLAIPLEALQYVLKMSNHDLIRLSKDCKYENGWESDGFLEKVTPWEVKASYNLRCFAKKYFGHLYGALKRIKHVVS